MNANKFYPLRWHLCFWLSVGIGILAESVGLASLVCREKADLYRAEFRFQIRSAEKCSSNEKELEMKEGEAGILLFTPAQVPGEAKPSSGQPFFKKKASPNGEAF